MNATAAAGFGRLRGELLRFVLVGGTSAAITFSIYRGLMLSGASPHPALALGFVAGTVFSFFANRLFTFNLAVPMRRGEVLRFVLVYATALGAHVGVNALMLAWLGRGEVGIAVSFAIATCVSTATTFAGMKWFAFAGDAPPPAATPARSGHDPVAGVAVARPRLSLVIPCYNESANLPLLVQRLRESFLDERSEVILVDNGSTDDSPAVLAALLDGQARIRSLRVERNQGYGYGILAGLEAAQGELLGWTHADLQTDPVDALRGLELFASGAEACFVKGRRYGRPAGDAIFTVGMSLFETVLLGRPMWDINAQPTLFPRDFFRRWNDPPHDFALDLYAYHQARRCGLDVRRFPVRFGPRAHGRSHWNVDWRAKLRFIRRTVDFSWRLRRGLGAR
ncbi:glycosyltransferase [Lysobacter antibioticus]|uniref:glycosyltransferase n=1 Tax=Lysobacter antibioticus TaxID=84531 RepID=UPI00034560D5|nr:glycosyltransferase [Lysobacter antibioticus]